LVYQSAGKTRGETWHRISPCDGRPGQNRKRAYRKSSSTQCRQKCSWHFHLHAASGGI